MAQFEAEVDEQFLLARLRVVKEGQIRSATDLSAWLKQLKIVTGLDREQIRAAFTSDPALGASFIIAKAQAPQHGQAGRLEFEVAVDQTAQYANEGSDSEQIDFRSSTSFGVVNAGDCIASLVDPTPGVDGINLRGHRLPSLDGKRVEVQLGDGVLFDQNQKSIIATQFGMPIYRNGTIKVEPVLNIDGNVDLHSGNVKFDGAVCIKGDIVDGFSVSAVSLEVYGSVGASFVEVSEDLKIRLGVNGKGRAIIKVGGQFEAQYVNEAVIQSEGPVFVKKQIMNSKIFCHNQVTCSQIVGGECFAFLGIISKQLGSDLGVRTNMYPGTSFKVIKLEIDLKKLAQEIEETLKHIKVLLGRRAYFRSLNSEKQDAIRRRVESFYSQCDKYSSIVNEVELIRSGFKYEPSSEMIVFRKINKNVRIKTEKCIMLTHDPIVGPLRLFEDTKRRIFRRSSKVKGGIKIKAREEEQGEIL